MAGFFPISSLLFPPLLLIKVNFTSGAGEAAECTVSSGFLDVTHRFNFQYQKLSFARANCQPPFHSDKDFLQVSFPLHGNFKMSRFPSLGHAGNSVACLGAKNGISLGKEIEIGAS